jgi:hypothetical protein
MLLVIGFMPIAVCAQAAGQSSNHAECKLTLDKSPTIRGLKLGMSAEQLLALFLTANQNPNVKRVIDDAQGYPNYGVARILFHATGYPTAFKERFAGIDTINTTLFDGQVVELIIYYAGSDSIPRGPRWIKVDDFIAKLKEPFNLPDARDWLYNPQGSKTLKCIGFEIHASTSSGQGGISLIGKPYVDLAKERAAADEEQRRREFKP